MSTTDPSDPRVLEPGKAPTPFTADEIRRGCPLGRTIRMQVEAEGTEPAYRVSRFVRCDDAGATIEQTRSTADGDPLAPPNADETTWLQFQAHASFPADLTTIRSERITTPVGDLDCLRYTVTEGATTQTFWFARTLPGMPVRYETRQDGRILRTVTMVANVMP